MPIVNEEVPTRAILNSGVEKPHYAIRCPECQVVALKGMTLPLTHGSSLSSRAKGHCYKCGSLFRVRYSLADATPGAPLHTVLKIPTSLDVKLQVNWGPRSKKYIAALQAEAAAGAAPAAPAVDAIQVAELVEEAVAGARAKVIDEMRQVVEDAKREAATARSTTVIEIHTSRDDEPQSAVNARERHAAYVDALDAVTATGKCLLVGPPGSGKSTLARQIAEDLGYEFTFLACTEGLSEAHILGRMNASGEYVPSAFVEGFEGSGPYAKARGVVHLWDEVDAMDANTALVINEALSNGHVSVPNRAAQPFAKMRDNFLQFAAANTWGTGAQVEHTGRNALDAAFLDRFAMTAIWVDYDLEREAAIASAGGIEDVGTALWQIRENARRHQIRRPVSTRAFINAARLKKGRPEHWTFQRLLDRFFAGWPTPERTKVMEGVKQPAESYAPEIQTDDGLAPSMTGDDAVKCPKCGGSMIRRVARRGPRRGQTFFGCLRFPNCNGTREALS